LWNHAMDAGRYAMESNKPIEHLTAEQRARSYLERKRNMGSNAR